MDLLYLILIIVRVAIIFFIARFIIKRIRNRGNNAADTNTNTNAVDEVNKSNRPILRAVIGLVIIVVIGAGGFYIYNNYQQTNRYISESSSIYHTEIITPNTTEIHLDNDFGTIHFPDDFIYENMEFTIKSTSDYETEGLPKDIDYIYPLDITLSNMHNLNSIVEIELYYNEYSIPQNVDESRYTSVMYFNEDENAWEYTYYEIDELENRIKFKTDHFSKFALVFGDNRKSCKPVNIPSIMVEIGSLIIKSFSSSTLEMYSNEHSL